MTEIQAQIRKENLKATPQRLAIYEYLLQTINHPCVEDIYQAIVLNHPSISLATVYKTLDTFHSVGLVQKLQINQEYARYDSNIAPHAHLVCKNCGFVRDAQDIVFENLQISILENYGFVISDEEHIFYGICEQCR